MEIVEGLMLHLDNAQHFELKQNLKKTIKVVEEQTPSPKTLPSRSLMKHSQGSMPLHLDQTAFLYSKKSSAPKLVCSGSVGFAFWHTGSYRKPGLNTRF